MVGYLSFYPVVLIDLTTKTKLLGTQFIALLNLEWEPSNLSVWGPLLYKMRHRVVWTYGVPPDPYALIRITNLNGNHGY